MSARALFSSFRPLSGERSIWFSALSRALTCSHSPTPPCGRWNLSPYNISRTERVSVQASGAILASRRIPTRCSG